MKKNIQIALVINKTNELKQLFHDISQGYSVTECYSAAELVNSKYYDIIVIHENYLKDFDRMKCIGSKVIILTNSQSKIADLYPQLKELNIYTVVQWPSSSKEIMRYIDNAYLELLEEKKSQATGKAQGKTILVTSFSNGSGKTLIAYNLAAKLGTFFSEELVCLTDMNTPFSVSRALLNIQDSYSWDSLRPLLKDNPPEKNKVQNVIYNTKYNFALLSGPTDFDTNHELHSHEFINLQTSLSNIFKSVVFDFHTIANNKHFDYVKGADLVVIVINLTSQGILQANRGLQYIREYKPQLLEKVRFVFNNVDESKGRTPQLIESKLDIKPFATVDEDREAVMTFIENGELFTDKTLLIDTQLYGLAEKIVKELY